MSKLIDTLNAFFTTSSQGPKYSVAKLIAFNYTGDKEGLKHDFHDILISEEPALNKPIQALLDDLKIPEKKRGRFIGAPITVYDLLKEIEALQPDNDKANILINAIDDNAKRDWFPIIMTFLLALLGVEIAGHYLEGTFSVINEIITVVWFAPIASAVYTTGVFIYSLIESVRNKNKESFLHRVQNNFFKLASTALKMVAYSLVIAFAALSGSPLISTLLVIATAIDIVKELAGFIHLKRELKKENAESNDHPTLIEQQTHARHENDYIKRRNSLVINVIAAVLITAVVAAWCFVPGGLVVVAAAIVGIVLINVCKKLAHKYSDSVLKKSLNSTFEQLESKDQNQPGHHLSSEVSLETSLNPDQNMSTARMSIQMAEDPALSKKTVIKASNTTTNTAQTNTTEGIKLDKLIKDDEHELDDPDSTNRASSTMV